MGVISDLENIKEKTVLAITASLLFIAPGLATVHTFNRVLFYEQDVFKIILIAVAFVVPLVTALFLPVLSIAVAFEDNKKQKSEITPAMVLALDLVVSNFIVYLWITLKQFYYFNFKGFVIRCFITALVSFSAFMFIAYIYYKNKQHKKPK
jgi:hypothetical protein